MRNNPESGVTLIEILIAVSLLSLQMLLGLLGTVGGCALGWGLALVLLRAMEQFLGVSIPPLQLSAGPFLLAAILGPFATRCSNTPSGRASKTSISRRGRRPITILPNACLRTR